MLEFMFDTHQCWPTRVANEDLLRRFVQAAARAAAYFRFLRQPRSQPRKQLRKQRFEPIPIVRTLKGMDAQTRIVQGRELRVTGRRYRWLS